MEVITLKQVNNGWMLIWDDPELENGPHITVKEGRDTALDNGLIDAFVSTFLMRWEEDDIDNIFEDKEYQIQIDVAKIKRNKR